MAIWSDSVINTFAAEAELEIATQVKCITKRIALDVRSGESLYNVPEDVISIRRVTWLGKKLEAKEFRGLLQYPIISPAGVIGAFTQFSFNVRAFFSSSSNSTPSGPPYLYFYSGYGENVIKLFPTPAMNILPTGLEDLFGPDIASMCIVEYYAFPDTSTNTYRLPSYIARRLIKCFVLSKCYAIESPGQDLVASQRFAQRFTELMSNFRSINDGVFVSKVNTRSAQMNGLPTRISRPRLPSNFGVVVE